MPAATPSLRLSDVFSSGMVLQRGAEIPITGHAPPGQRVRLRLEGHPSASLATATGHADADGRFRLVLPPLQAGGPHTLSVSTDHAEVTLDDVLIGEVWLCSGQSNMEWTVESSARPEDELADADFEHIRLLNVPKLAEREPTDRLAAKWTHASRATAAPFSAVGFFFARRLHRELGVPVGIVSSCWGGTCAEAWTSLEGLRGAESLLRLARDAEAGGDLPPVGPYLDTGNEGEPTGWATRPPSPDEETIPLPQPWQRAGFRHNGAVWFHRVVRLGRSAPAAATISLGVLDDFDTVYLNGHRVGGMGPESDSPWATPRVYAIPPGVLREGDNLIAVRIFDQWGEGGFMGPSESMWLETAGGLRHPLAGPWSVRVERALPLRSPEGGGILPTQLYNGMIQPLTPLPVAGVLWYQGESNVPRAAQYRTLLPAMIGSWRAAWHEQTGRALPFFIVQLAGFMPPFIHPGDSQWAELREVQAQVSKETGGVHLISAIDLGDPADIHPRDKQSVARRLADAALATVHARRSPWQSPTFRHAEFVPPDANTPGHAIIDLDHAEGLHVRTPDPQAFQLCGDDRVWHWADAQIVRDGRLLVRAAAVPRPVAVRYAWQDHPPCPLYNRAGLPLLPFRSDDFPLTTAAAS